MYVLKVGCSWLIDMKSMRSRLGVSRHCTNPATFKASSARSFCMALARPSSACTEKAEQDASSAGGAAHFIDS